MVFVGLDLFVTFVYGLVLFVALFSVGLVLHVFSFVNTLFVFFSPLILCFLVGCFAFVFGVAFHAVPKFQGQARRQSRAKSREVKLKVAMGQKIPGTQKNIKKKHSIG